jgi:glucose-1-phosphate cytidylyltransferase
MAPPLLELGSHGGRHHHWSFPALLGVSDGVGPEDRSGVKVVVLAGGQGSRLLEETRHRPKPLVAIGERPILWHVMNHYAHFGFRDFMVAVGYGGTAIKNYFEQELRLQGDLKLDFSTGTVERINKKTVDWSVEFVETGKSTPTGGRLRQLRKRLSKTFFLTWSDGLSNIDISKLLDFHRTHGKLATVTAVRPPARFGRLDLDGDTVTEFAEKPADEGGWINGAYFVLEPEALDIIRDDESSWEESAMRELARRGEMKAYRHHGFWQCMDTLKEKLMLQQLWSDPDCPWRLG